MDDSQWFKFVFIYCPHCKDVKKLQRRKIYCKCGQSFGWLHKNYTRFAVYGGDAVPLTIPSKNLKRNIVDEKEAPQIQCPYCKTTIYSLYRHDFQWCKCGKMALDGGFDYRRIIGPSEIEDNTN